ncbi:MAG: hypothetical protein KF699_11980 [Phycisphaeraceae bacterium]|nr:hypothetical protein [Phycisphaeraceae bacterium]MBX3407182.1 hypothetical protein [Phycisphaeraceae bacterium]
MKARNIGHAAAACVVLLLAAVAGSGCQLVGVMAASAHRSGSHEVKAKYRGLEDRTFAVVVSADRSIQADHPDIVVTLTREISRRLAADAAASGYVPANDVLAFQFQRPNWVAMTPQQLAEEFGVQRLVYVDLAEYRLTDPGNPYVWKGVAIGTVSVTEADGSMPSLFAFRENVRVTYPDLEGVSPLEQPRDTVKIALTSRFVQRATWLFFDHTEKNVMEY